MGCRVPCPSSFAFKSNVNEVVITKKCNAHTTFPVFDMFLCCCTERQASPSRWWKRRQTRACSTNTASSGTKYILFFFFLLRTFLISALLIIHFLSKVAQHISSLLYESLYDGILIRQIFLTSFSTLWKIHWLKKGSRGTKLEDYEISSWFRKCIGIEGKVGVIIWRGKIQF